MRALLLTALFACSTPPMNLLFKVSPEDGIACGSQEQPAEKCADVSITCRAVVSLRIIDPNDPTAPYVSICQEFVETSAQNLCSLNAFQIDPEDVSNEIPLDNLEVQIVIYPAEDACLVDHDGDPTTARKLECPSGVTFDGANGFAITRGTTTCGGVSRDAHPAIAGRAFYRPGDEKTVVELGCPDLAILNDATCVGRQTVHVTATVVDFDTSQPVSAALGNRLAIAIGEPVVSGVEYVLNPADTIALERTHPGPIPAWGGDVELEFQSFACLEVLDTVPASTATLTCRRAEALDMIDITGVRLAKETLDQILLALGNPSLDKGLVVGIVLDDLGPSAGKIVESDIASTTVRYLSADGTNFNAPSTTSSGIFVSTDAPFITTFRTSFGQNRTVFATGGLVNNKVTIVVLRNMPGQVGG